MVIFANLEAEGPKVWNCWQIWSRGAQSVELSVVIIIIIINRPHLQETHLLLLWLLVLFFFIAATSYQYLPARQAAARAIRESPRHAMPSTRRVSSRSAPPRFL